MLKRSISKGAFITASLAGVLAISLVSGCEKPGVAATAAPAERPPSPVSVGIAVSKDVPVYIDAIGKTVAVESVAIVPQIAGKIIAAHVVDGAYISKGQLLFEIDPRPFEAALASANATLAQNVAESAWAEADFKRTEELLPSKVVSQLEYDQKKSNLGVSQAKIDSAKASILAAQLNLEYTKIYAPIDGRAGVRMVDPGNVVKANEGTMLSIQRLDPIYAEFTVTENDLGTVRKYMASRRMETGNEANLGLKAMVEIPGNSDRIISALGNPSTQPSEQAGAAPSTSSTNAGGAREATVTFLDNTVQSGSGTVKLRATVPNGDRYFWPGQFVNVRVVLTTRKGAVLIPTIAEQIGQQGPFVYVVKADSTVEQRPIKAGQRQGEMLVIDSGVNAGEQVVTVGHMMIANGAKVQVLPSAPAGSAPGAAH